MSNVLRKILGRQHLFDGAAEELGFIPIQSVSANLPTLKYYNGTEWVAKPLKRWNGTFWEAASLKMWDGTNWIETQ